MQDLVYHISAKKLLKKVDKFINKYRVLDLMLIYNIVLNSILSSKIYKNFIDFLCALCYNKINGKKWYTLLTNDNFV